MPLMVTFFNVRKGRDALFKRGMRHLFPTRRRVPQGDATLERKYGIRFVGWFNVTEGSTWNNVVILDLPNYAVLDQLYADTVDCAASGTGSPSRSSTASTRSSCASGWARTSCTSHDRDASSPRIVALRELAADAELERGDFLYEATEQLRRFLDANRSAFARSVRSSSSTTSRTTCSTTRSTRRGRRGSPTRTRPTASGTTRSRCVDSIGELIELYNPADIFAWLIEAARDAPAHLVAGGRAGPRGGAGRGRRDDWQAELPPPQQETLAAQRLWQLADAYRTQLVDGPGPAPARVHRQRRGGPAHEPATSCCSRSPRTCSFCAPTADSRPRSTCPTSPRRS